MAKKKNDNQERLKKIKKIKKDFSNKLEDIRMERDKKISKILDGYQKVKIRKLIK